MGKNEGCNYKDSISTINMSGKWYIHKYADIYELNIETKSHYIVCELNANSIRFGKEDGIILTDGITNITKFTYNGK